MTDFKVKVTYIGIIKSQSGKKTEEVLITQEKNIQDLLQTLGYSEAHQKFILITVNDKETTLHEILKPNMEISLFLPTGGG